MLAINQWLVSLYQRYFKPRNRSSAAANLLSTARVNWTDRYVLLAKAVRHWQWGCGLLAILCVLLVITVMGLLHTARVVPYVIEVNQGIPLRMKALSPMASHDNRLVQFAVSQFILNSRTVVSDKDAEAQLLQKVYAFAADDTLPFLQHYYDAHNPLVDKIQTTTEVTLVAVLPLSPQTWQVVWDETTRSTLNHQVMNTTRWLAVLTTAWGNVNPLFITDNPFGIYVTHLSWSPSLTPSTSNTTPTASTSAS